MNTPSLVEALGAALDERAAQIRTALPAQVMTYHRTTQTADVRPMVWTDGLDAPVIPEVPVMWPRAGGGYLVFPLDPTKHRETGLLICCESDITEWRRTAEPATPADQARHHLQNAVFIPGLVPRGEDLDAPAGATVLNGFWDLRLGQADCGPGNDGSAVRGGLLYDAFNLWLPLVQAAIVAGGGTDITAANTALLGAIVGALSSQVKVAP